MLELQALGGMDTHDGDRFALDLILFALQGDIVQEFIEGQFGFFHDRVSEIAIEFVDIENTIETIDEIGIVLFELERLFEEGHKVVEGVFQLGLKLQDLPEQFFER